MAGDFPSARLEFRIPGADVNPYLGLAMYLAAGLWGIEHVVEPPPVATGDGRVHAYPGMRQLPRDLMGAADALADSAAAHALFGNGFVNAYVASRRHEFDALRREVSAEEKARYFEIA